MLASGVLNVLLKNVVAALRMYAWLALRAGAASFGALSGCKELPSQLQFRQHDGNI